MASPYKGPEVLTFLGLANYYYKFLKGYSKFVALLTNLLKNEKRWLWSKECQEAFDRLKHFVASEPVLCLPDFEKAFEVHTNASDRDIARVLVQKGHLVAFENRNLKHTGMLMLEKALGVGRAERGRLAPRQGARWLLFFFH